MKNTTQPAVSNLDPRIGTLVRDGATVHYITLQGRHIEGDLGFLNFQLEYVDRTTKPEATPGREQHCTHPLARFCDCDWCRYVKAFRKPEPTKPCKCGAVSVHRSDCEARPERHSEPTKPVGPGPVNAGVQVTARRYEWDVRPLDENGDALDVLHFDTAREARIAASCNLDALHPDCKAVVVELHDLVKDAAGDVCASYQTVASFGDAGVVALWSGVSK